MKIGKAEFKLYLILFLAILDVIFAKWSLWHSPWRVGIPYRVIITYVTLIAIVIYKVIKFFRKQGK